ncbi:DUF3558 family protein [Actinokineospora iranica]|uniref:DUF3558 domain-containing protein n=1 Tax=Actinokineospora iranica TaxID=1271860 RepID=A0A1G6XXF9_9PSEU|nr:DUF3558 family protein [Actinokineospora iranica]SDD82849.1 Protein of unknown function [Actinokineospora iranica]
MARNFARAVLLSSALLLAAGCGDPVAGVPGTPTTQSSAAEPTTASSASSPPSTSSAPVKKSTFTNAELCELLTADEVAQFGAANPTPTYNGSTAHPQCQWRGEMVVAIEFGPDSSVEVIRTGEGITNTNIEVMGLPAVLQVNTRTRSCQVLAKINGGKSSLATGIALLSGGRGKYNDCDMAQKLANIVIPKVQV